MFWMVYRVVAYTVAPACNYVCRGVYQVVSDRVWGQTTLTLDNDKIYVVIHGIPTCLKQDHKYMIKEGRIIDSEDLCDTGWVKL